MDAVALSTAAVAIDWQNYANVVANTVLPDLIKITMQLVIIPLIGMGGRHLAHKLAQSHFKFLVKYAAQKVQRGAESWVDKRKGLVLDAAKGTLWLKWLSQEQMDQMLEAAVAEWNQEFYQALGEKP